MESPRDAYSRGVADGKILTRLDGHDAQLKEMEGTLRRVVSVEEKLTLAVQSLGQAAEAAAATRIATAEALKDAKVAEDRERTAEVAKTEQFWTPYTRFFTFLVGLATIAYSLFSIFHH
jgi:hypothetical protein